jgi:hypothetical protein
MYKKQIRFGLRNFGALYGYGVGMVVEVAATLVLMGVGFLISILGFYLLK